jgi:hypothetical protein
VYSACEWKFRTIISPPSSESKTSVQHLPGLHSCRVVLDVTNGVSKSAAMETRHFQQYVSILASPKVVNLSLRIATNITHIIYVSLNNRNSKISCNTFSHFYTKAAKYLTLVWYNVQ